MTHFTTAHSIDAQRLADISSFGSPDVVFRGDLESISPNACFRLEGELHGSIHFLQGGIVHIAKGAKVQGGSIEADLIYIEGQVNANIHARLGVEITSSAIVTGKVSYDAELDIHKNARIRGALEYTGDMNVAAASEASFGSGSPLPDATPSGSTDLTGESQAQNVVSLMPAIASSAASADAYHSYAESVHGAHPDDTEVAGTAFHAAAHVG